LSSLDVVQSFIDVSRGLRNPADLDALLQAITREMGFDHYALIHHVDLTPYEPELRHMATGQLVALMDYPEQWIEEYIGNDIVSYDPVLLASHKTNVGFAWSEIPKLIELKRPHVEQLERGRRAGIGDGFTVPSNVPGEANGSSNFVVRTGRQLPERNLMMAQLVGSYAFEAARNIVTHAHRLQFGRVNLSPRQLDCILLIGQGKSTWDIARILGISEATVKEYIDDARRRYGVKTRIQLVLRAVYDGHLPLIDALR
jgi:LuxR family quorum-sensing system transcriptional regulator CciR